jgi:hypothetical protein
MCSATECLVLFQYLVSRYSGFAITLVPLLTCPSMCLEHMHHRAATCADSQHWASNPDLRRCHLFSNAQCTSWLQIPLLHPSIVSNNTNILYSHGAILRCFSMYLKSVQ